MAVNPLISDLGMQLPRMTVMEIVAEPMVIHRVARGRTLRRRVAELLSLVGFIPCPSWP